MAPLTNIERGTLASVPVVYGQNGTHVKLSPNGKPVLNLAVYDWLGFVENDHIKDVAIKTLREYGVGSCGPMGFYGTIGGFEWLSRQQKTLESRRIAGGRD